MVSRLERKVIFYYDKEEFFYKFIAIRPHYDPTATGSDPLTRLFNTSDEFVSTTTWLIAMRSETPNDFEMHVRPENWIRSRQLFAEKIIDKVEREIKYMIPKQDWTEEKMDDIEEIKKNPSSQMDFYREVEQIHVFIKDNWRTLKDGSVLRIKNREIYCDKHGY